MNCGFHIQNPLSFICVAPHKCSRLRKLCVECVYDHTVDFKEILPINLFKKQVIEKLKLLVLNQTYKLTRLRQAYKSVTSQIESKMKQFWQDLTATITKIIDNIEQKAQQNVDALKDIYIEDLSYIPYYQLENLVQLQQGNKLNLNYSQKDNSLDKLEKFLERCLLLVKNFSERIQKECSELIGQPKEVLKKNEDNRINTLESNQIQEYTQDIRGITFKNKTKTEYIVQIDQKFLDVYLNYIISLAKVFEEGQYERNQRNGAWKYIFENIEIGGGDYNQEGLKNGKWIELSEDFQQYSQVRYEGQYKHGKKIDRQDIEYRQQSSDPFQKCGEYDKAGDELKLDNWIELSDNFMNFYEVTYQGHYKEDKKVGQWDIFLNHKGKNQQMKIQIYSGGGVYDNNSIVKQGNWIELDDRFNACCQITHRGEYLNDRKIGRWHSYFENKAIGGGSSDENSVKIGKWILLSENFFIYNPVIYIGQFISGEKVGQWDILKIKFEDEIMIYEKIGQNNHKDVNNN